MDISKRNMTHLWSGIARVTLIAFAAGMLLAATAHASCADPTVAPHRRANSPVINQANAPGAQPQPDNSIVGLWHVTYSSGGELFYEAFDQWHRDGLEIESANLSPVGGNVCMGTWKKLGQQVYLMHVGWSFDASGNSAGSFTLTETNTVSDDGNTYQGTFDFKAYDLDGNLVQEVTGTLKATRIDN